MDRTARGVRFSQLVRLRVAGRAWPSLIGVVWGDVGRKRMACRRCEWGRRSGRRVTQKVGVIQHSASRGNLGRQELAGRVVVWGRESRGGRSVVCVGLRLRRVPQFMFLALLQRCGRLLGHWVGVWECEADGPAMISLERIKAAWWMCAGRALGDMCTLAYAA